MKNKIFFMSGILAIMLIFIMMTAGCDTNPNGGAETSYTGTDLAGNNYKLTIVSSRSISGARAVSEGDDYELQIEISGGQTVHTTGTIDSVLENTFYLSDPSGKEVSVTLGSGTAISSIVGTITLSDGNPFLVRTFEQVYLRASKWSESVQGQELYGSGDCIILSDIYDGNVNDLFTGDEFLVRISGNVNKKLGRTGISINHVSPPTASDPWGVWTNIAGVWGNNVKEIEGDFDVEMIINKNSAYNPSEVDITQGEILIGLEDALYYYNTANPEWGYGTPVLNNADIGKIFATVRNFKILPVIKQTIDGLGEFSWDGGDNAQGWNLDADTKGKLADETYKYFVIGISAETVEKDGGLSGIGIVINYAGGQYDTDYEAFPWYWKNNKTGEYAGSNGWITYENLTGTGTGKYGAEIEDGVIYLKYDLSAHPSYNAFKAAIGAAQWAYIGIDVFEAWKNDQIWWPIVSASFAGDND